MNGEDAYESWKRGRAEVDPPEGLADRVMEAVKVSSGPGAVDGAAHGFLETMVSRSGAAAAAAVLVLGFGLGALRLGLPLLMVLFSS